MEEAMQALEKLSKQWTISDLILFIEMPVLDGWGFMNEWKQVKERLSQKYKSIYQVLPSRLKTNKSENNPDILDICQNQ
jgi:CheY-like chemotaxis protein